MKRVCQTLQWQQVITTQVVASQQAAERRVVTAVLNDAEHASIEAADGSHQKSFDLKTGTPVQTADRRFPAQDKSLQWMNNLLYA